ncbi:helix-turn-helix transcriptional regulator [Nocardia huaxiensis]|nr:LuxR family transcriptional regulator [Nocardia huaxiensis]UFT00387.1 LuxR C-terminal-related transcriptional regulator [Nocardia huaxiensis]
MREWPLIGRSEELEFIGSAMRRRDAARGVVLAGGAGVGKTRLAREVVALERRRGARVWWVSATECARAVPLGAFAELHAEPGDPHTVVTRAVEWIAGGPDPVVVAVDDAHLLDDLSALVVNQLVLHRRATVVLTVRSGEPTPDAIAAVWKDEHLERLETQPLSERETGALVAAALEGTVESGTIRRLWRLSRGNVLFLRQLVGSSAFRREGQVWRLAGEVEVPAILSDLVDVRMSVLPSDVRTVVDLLALSEPLPVDLLDTMVERGAVERAEDAGVVAVDTGEEHWDARLAHPLFGEVRRAAMGRLRARRLRGEIATALADSASRQSDVPIRRAVLLLESDLAADAPLFVQVGAHALGLCEFQLADRLGRAAVTAGGGFPAQAIVAYAAMWSARPDLAEVELAALTDLAADDADYVRAMITRATNLAYLLNNPDQGRAVLAEAVDRVANPSLRDTLRAQRAMIDSCAGDVESARTIAREVLSADDVLDATVLFGSVALVVWAAATGREEMTAHAVRGEAACDRLADFANYRSPLMTQYVFGLVWAGRFDLAAAATTRYHAAVGDNPYASVGLLTGFILLARGDLEAATDELRQARRDMAMLASAGAGTYYGTLITATQCLAMHGDLDEARAARTEMRRQRAACAALHIPMELLAESWVAAAEGNTSAALAFAHDAAASARQLGQPMHTVLALHTATRFGDTTTAAELADLATRVDGPRAQAAAAHAAALAGGDPAALLTAATAFEDMGDRLSAADAAAQAAVAFRHQGRKGSGNLAAARALRLSADCGGPPTPAVSLVANPLPLSAREREIITLAAEGLTNREIAEQLMLSRRTVEGHLYRASNKLGITSRQEFAAVLGLGDQ